MCGSPPTDRAQTACLGLEGPHVLSFHTVSGTRPVSGGPPVSTSHLGLTSSRNVGLVARVGGTRIRDRPSSPSVERSCRPFLLQKRPWVTSFKSGVVEDPRNPLRFLVNNLGTTYVRRHDRRKRGKVDCRGPPSTCLHLHV